MPRRGTKSHPHYPYNLPTTTESVQMSLGQNAAQLAAHTATISSLTSQLATLHVNDRQGAQNVQNRITGQEKQKKGLETRRERLERELVMVREAEDRRIKEVLGDCWEPKKEEKKEEGKGKGKGKGKEVEKKVEKKEGEEEEEEEDEDSDIEIIC